MSPPIQARMKFLASAAHLYSSTAPATAAHLMREYQDFAAGNDIALNDADLKRACQACGTISIPGWTSRTRIVDTPRSKKPRANPRKQGPDARRQAQKLVISKCLACHRSVKTPLVPSKKAGGSEGRDSTAVREFLPNSLPVAIKTEGGIHGKQETQHAPSANISSKKRAKARKQGGLQAMLDKAKAMPAQSTSFGLDLMDLMKST